MKNKKNNGKKNTIQEVQTYNPFQNLFGDNNMQNNNKKYNNKVNINNKTNSNNNKTKEDIYLLNYFLKDESKLKNRDRNKIKKLLTPLLTFVVENQNFNNNNSSIQKDFKIIIKNKFDKLSVEHKDEFIGEAADLYKREKILEEKIISAFNDAKVFLRDFRNIMMHKNVKNDTFKRAKFNNFNGELFKFITIALKSELDNNLKKITTIEENNKENNKKDQKLSTERLNVKDQYISKILEELEKKDFIEKNDFSKIPFIYALSILAMFTESKYIKEVLDLIKRKRFFDEFVSSFSLRGGYKTFVPGISLEDEDLYLKQLDMKDEVNKEVSNTGRRLVKKLDYFKVDNNKNIDNEFSIYKKIMRFYGYRTSFPRIDEMEDYIRVFKAEEIVKSNIDKMEGMKQYYENARAYNRNIGPDQPKLQVNSVMKELETDYKKVLPTLTNVFRNEDIFIREAAEFLSSKYKNEFGNSTWTISGNTIIWLEPNDNIQFDTRKKTKPSKNGLNSIYKIVYNKENADRFSLNRYNLRALITSILLNGGLSFKDLKNTASNNIKINENKNQNNNTNNKLLADDLKEKSLNWNRYKQASFVVKVVRRNIIKDKHLHNRDSVSFFQEFLRTLYILDNRTGNVYDDAISIIKKYGINDNNISNEVKNILKANTLREMLDMSFDIFQTSKKKKGKSNQLQFKTWSKFAFLPCNEKYEQISKILQWDKVTDREKNDDLYKILLNKFKKDNTALPHIVKLYEKYIDNDEYAGINKYRLKEIRNTIAEEMLLTLMSLNYLSLINKNSQKYFTLESYKDNKDNSPLNFNLVWNLNPVIRIPMKDYMKKDVRSALNWIFDVARIKEKGNLQGKEDLQLCLNSAINTYKTITTHYILKTKCPKPTSIIENNILTADNIKDIVKILVWAQKELLYFICNMEADIIYTLFQIPQTTEEIEKQEEQYCNFSYLVESHNKYINDVRKLERHKNNSVLDPRIKIARNMLAHGRLYDSSSSMQYSDVISVLSDSTNRTLEKSLEKLYLDKDNKKSNNHSNNNRNRNNNYNNRRK